MKIMQTLKLTAAIAAAVSLTGCITDSDDSSDDAPKSASGYIFPANAIFVAPNAQDGDDISEAFSTALYNASTDDVVVLPRGSFKVNQSIVKDNASGITVTGYGKDATKLDFSGSPQDDGIRFTGGTDITVRDLGVYEAPKNAIKADGVNGIHMLETAVVWESPLDDGDDSTTNGAYGLYPVSSQNVLVENNYAYGSADAGIYVGQSENIVVRNNIAEHNVAGIEIENSEFADVYDNEAKGNTAGILVFDLPGLPTKAYGGNVRIFNNNSHDNNLNNYGKGAVAIAPPGTGVLVFATSGVEIYNNTLSNNETSAVELASYFMEEQDLSKYATDLAATIQQGWSPVIKSIYVHDNTFVDNGANPRGDLITEIVQGYSSQYNASGSAQRFPAVLYGGIGELLANAQVLTSMGQSAYSADDKVCVGDNTNGNTGDLVDDLNVGQVYDTDPTDSSNFDAQQMPVAKLLIDEMTDKSLMDCTLTRLGASVVTFKGETYGCTGDDQNTAACQL